MVIEPERNANNVEATAVDTTISSLDLVYSIVIPIA